jgi:hypothetical protein
VAEEKQSGRVNYKWFSIYSTAYHIAIFTDIMDNSTGYSKSFKIVGLSSWCLTCALMVQGLNCTTYPCGCPLFALLLHCVLYNNAIYYCGITLHIPQVDGRELGIQSRSGMRSGMRNHLRAGCEGQVCHKAPAPAPAPGPGADGGRWTRRPPRDRQHRREPSACSTSPVRFRRQRHHAKALVHHFIV